MKTPSISLNILPLVIVAAISACSKMNDLHDKYLKEGEQVYVGQPDSTKVFPGDRRALLRYWVSDPKAAKLLIYWNAKQDSLLIDIPPSARTEAVDVWINDLEEKSHSFELITMNEAHGNRSIPLEINSKVYGEMFRESLSNRRIRSAIKESDTGPLIISWLAEIEQSVNVNLKYVNTADQEVDVLITPSESETLLDDYKEALSYRTLFKPDTASIDTFYTTFADAVGQVEIPLSKDSFSRWNPPGIPYDDIGSDYRIERIWDGSYSYNPVAFYVFNIPEASLPFSFTFDMGVTKKLSRFKHWQRINGSVAYTIQNARKFEIWGSSTPDVNDAFDGWTKLGTYEIIRPEDALTEAKKEEYASKGDEFIVDPDAPAIRYIRYVVLETWDANPTNGALAELTFYEFQN